MGDKLLALDATLTLEADDGPVTSCALDARSRAAQRSPRHNGDGSDDAAATPEQRPGEPQIKLQAVHVALAKGNMLCVAELLEWLWRAKGQAPTAQCPNAPVPHAPCPMLKAQRSRSRPNVDQ